MSVVLNVFNMKIFILFSFCLDVLAILLDFNYERKIILFQKLNSQIYKKESVNNVLPPPVPISEVIGALC